MKHTVQLRHIAIGCLLVIAEGCAARHPPVTTPAAQSSMKVMTFVATAYCQRGTTAAGVAVRQGVVAADPTVIPLGSLIRIDGSGWRDGVYRVLDTGTKVRGHRIDLFIKDCSVARKFGRRTVRVALMHSAR